MKIFFIYFFINIIKKTLSLINIILKNLFLFVFRAFLLSSLFPSIKFNLRNYSYLLILLMIIPTLFKRIQWLRGSFKYLSHIWNTTFASTSTWCYIMFQWFYTLYVSELKYLYNILHLSSHKPMWKFLWTPQKILHIFT